MTGGESAWTKKKRKHPGKPGKGRGSIFRNQRRNIYCEDIDKPLRKHETLRLFWSENFRFSFSLFFGTNFLLFQVEKFAPRDKSLCAGRIHPFVLSKLANRSIYSGVKRLDESFRSILAIGTNALAK